MVVGRDWQESVGLVDDPPARVIERLQETVSARVCRECVPAAVLEHLSSVHGRTSDYRRAPAGGQGRGGAAVGRLCSGQENPQLHGAAIAAGILSQSRARANCCQTRARVHSLAAFGCPVRGCPFRMGGDDVNASPPSCAHARTRARGGVAKG
jgi:hypothetical protein